MIIERIALSSAFLYFVHLYFAGCASERVTDVALSEINEWMFKKKGIYVIYFIKFAGKRRKIIRCSPCQLKRQLV